MCFYWLSASVDQYLLHKSNFRFLSLCLFTWSWWFKLGKCWKRNRLAESEASIYFKPMRIGFNEKEKMKNEDWICAAVFPGSAWALQAETSRKHMQGFSFYPCEHQYHLLPVFSYSHCFLCPASLPYVCVCCVVLCCVWGTSIKPFRPLKKSKPSKDLPLGLSASSPLLINNVTSAVTFISCQNHGIIQLNQDSWWRNYIHFLSFSQSLFDKVSERT